MEKGNIVFMSLFFFLFSFFNWYIKFSLVDSVEWVHSPPSQIIAVSSIASETCKALLTLVFQSNCRASLQSLFSVFSASETYFPSIYFTIQYAYIFLILSVALWCKNNFQSIRKDYLDALQSPVLQPIIRCSWNFLGGNLGVMDFKNIF